ncbi:succinate dehydrogenase iron-sulfur subunit [Desulfosarcina alkanivorans]|uniref:Fumarate reductase iron-sulfur subunit n=1 Tax=Desulfosarcina alkanivorans TaxID=571177 RepID=A0A5K7YUH7_9BACT|nr:succinate dehydrogenase iron-sulfur subunit [Desulfosarcina alkanivorans]BBO71950.1 succinate dehydrogenase iron-sulfur subunit [Desulfosarcina alkanivorans]
MEITLKVQRFNPDIDKAPYYQTYTVAADPNERLLDALMQVKRFQDGSLGFRKSCAHGVCGSDAMRINGKDGLACKTLIREVAEKDGDTVTVEPLRYLPVQRDLIVDQSAFFKKYRSVRPFLINDEPVDAKERIQSQDERMRFDDTTNCILCASCYSACPVLEDNPAFLGPAAIAQAYRFNADTRDRGFDQRLAVLDLPDGVWPCQNHFQCTRSCPRGILITKRINQTKRMLEAHEQKAPSEK